MASSIDDVVVSQLDLANEYASFSSFVNLKLLEWVVFLTVATISVFFIATVFWVHQSIAITCPTSGFDDLSVSSSAELCSFTIAISAVFSDGLFISDAAGVDFLHPHHDEVFHEDSWIFSHWAVNVTITQSFVVTHVHSGIMLLYVTQSSDFHHLNIYQSLVTLGRLIFSQYVALISFATQIPSFELNLLV